MNSSSIYRSAPRGFAAAAVGICATLVTLNVAAQPDPFDDYEKWKQEDTAPPPAAPGDGTENKDPKEPADTDEPAFQRNKGLFSFGGRGMFSYTGTSNEALTGPDLSNTTLFYRLSPAVGYFLTENIQLGASIGLLGKSIAREGDRNTTELDVLTEVTAHYVLPMGKRFALMPGVGLGVYLGSSDRPLRVEDSNGDVTETQENTSTFGVSGSLYLSVAYQLSKNVHLRTGLALNALIGTESVSSQDESLSSSTAHFGLPLELYYSFH